LGLLNDVSNAITLIQGSVDNTLASIMYLLKKCNILGFSAQLMADYENLKDEALLHLLTDGDDVAFTVIYNRYWKSLIALAYRHTKDKFEAEEVVQEVFVSFWNRRNIVKIDSLGGYFATSVKFSIFKQVLRTSRRLEIVDKITQRQLNNNSSEAIDAKFLQEFVDGIIEHLPEKSKLVYKYSRKDGLSIAEIAQKMDIAEKTAEAHLTKALKVLRLNLKEFLVLLILIKFPH
jgi:RNA polymerase sigma-70 factor (ECF subfamily)